MASVIIFSGDTSNCGGAGNQPPDEAGTPALREQPSPSIGNPSRDAKRQGRTNRTVLAENRAKAARFSRLLRAAASRGTPQVPGDNGALHLHLPVVHRME